MRNKNDTQEELFEEMESPSNFHFFMEKMNETLSSRGFSPKVSESYLDFRKRAFPFLWKELPSEVRIFAFEFLLLRPTKEWNSRDILLYLIAQSVPDATEKELMDFAGMCAQNALERPIL
jgi:hypothetical protein